jgi:hypothetical protein
MWAGLFFFFRLGGMAQQLEANGMQQDIPFVPVEYRGESSTGKSGS